MDNLANPEMMNKPADPEAATKRVEAKANVIGTLIGLRGMAEIEVANGSNAWRSAFKMIDDAISDARSL